VHLDRAVEFDAQTVQQYNNMTQRIETFYDADGRYDFLQQRDIIAIAKSEERGQDPYFMQITHTAKKSFAEILEELGGDIRYTGSVIVKRVGRDLKPTDNLAVFEFKRAYRWKFDPSSRTE
jgi:hypothetical protein